MKDRQLWLEKMNWKDSLWEEECPFCEKNNVYQKKSLSL